jgi:hypothetical protein
MPTSASKNIDLGTPRRYPRLKNIHIIIYDEDSDWHESDLDKPLIVLKQKRPKTSPTKANRKMEVLTSPSRAVEVEDTTSMRGYFVFTNVSGETLQCSDCY